MSCGDYWTVSAKVWSGRCVPIKRCEIRPTVRCVDMFGVRRDRSSGPVVNRLLTVRSIARDDEGSITGKIAAAGVVRDFGLLPFERSTLGPTRTRTRTALKHLHLGPFETSDLPVRLSCNAGAAMPWPCSVSKALQNLRQKSRQQKERTNQDDRFL